MNSRTIDVVTGWETVATPDGYEGLRQLADAEFSGAVSAGTAWAFLLNGRVVGVFEGGIEDFADADVTAYRAADPSLPLLFAMQERGGDVQARYYTNETPLTDVDRTLSNGGFTGYVELSENVLSGDYYVVYHGGKSMSAAFVGTSERLLTGDEAFETAADEVGIYEVVDVDIELVDIPEPEPEPEPEPDPDADAEGEPGESDESGTDAGAAEPGPGPVVGTDPSAEGAEPSDATPAADAESAESAETPDASVGSGSGGGAPASDDRADAPSTAGQPAADEGASGTGAGTEADPVDGPARREPESDEEAADVGSEVGGGAAAGGEKPVDDGSEASTPAGGDGRDATGPRSREAPDDGAGAAGDDPVDAGARSGSTPSGPTPSESNGGETATDDAPGGSSASGPAADPDRAAESAGPDGAIADEARWQEARTIPSLDPEESTGDASAGGTGDDGDAGRERTARMQRRRERRRSTRDGANAGGANAGGSSAGGANAGGSSADGPSVDGSQGPAAADAPGGASVDPDGVERLRRRLSRARDRVASLEAEREELREERAEVQEERDRLREERADRIDRIEELEAERERLSSEVDRLESELDATGDAAAAASAAESMSSDRALSGTNLFVRYDSKGQATLKHAHAGEASREEVRENLRLEHHTTFETEGVVVDDRPYEAFLHDTTEYAFANWVITDLLYEIGGTGNRSELAGVFDAIPEIDRIELYGEVGVETADGVAQRAFDVICRDRMGDPLFVADINPSRNATTEAMVGSLVENTGTVASEAESLAAGFYVTESFYEPGALETVADRTGGGFLSRSKKRSFVKVSRKRGYHLCLVEARDGEFHLNVPEL